MKILVIGATGYLGSQIAKAIQESEHELFVLVRKGTDKAPLQNLGATIVDGDLTDFESLVNAFHEIDVVISTAIGYTNRKPADSIAAVDDVGNKNLGDAVKKAKVAKLIFISVLKADIAHTVPHFKQKYLSEQYFEALGLSFISLRPGGFLDQVLGWNLEAIRQHQLPVLMNADAKFTLINSADIVKAVMRSIDIRLHGSLIIDLGMAEPTTFNELAAAISDQTGQQLKVTEYPSPDNEMGNTLKFMSSGNYIADVSLQSQYFEEPSSLKASVAQWTKKVNL